MERSASLNDLPELLADDEPSLIERRCFSAEEATQTGELPKSLAARFDLLADLAERVDFIPGEPQTLDSKDKSLLYLIEQTSAGLRNSLYLGVKRPAAARIELADRLVTEAMLYIKSARVPKVMLADKAVMVAGAVMGRIQKDVDRGETIYRSVDQIPCRSSSQGPVRPRTPPSEKSPLGLSEVPVELDSRGCAYHEKEAEA